MESKALVVPYVSMLDALEYTTDTLLGEYSSLCYDMHLFLIYTFDNLSLPLHFDMSMRSKNATT
jgi:hypothetical protein